MSYALFAPWNDADFASLLPLTTLSLTVNLSGTGDFTAQIPLPSVSGDPLEGGIYYTTPETLGGSWYAVLKTELESADPDAPGNATWDINYSPFTPGLLPLRTELTRTGTGPGVKTFQLRWSVSAFDQSILGYNEFVLGVPLDGPVFGNGATYTSDYQVARCWFNRLAPYLPERPVHRGTHLSGGNFAGAQQIIKIGKSTHDRDFVIKPAEGVRVYRSLAAKPDQIAQLPGLVLGDPNVPLEGLWEGMTLGRKPIRLINKIDTPISQTVTNYQVASQDILTSVDALVTGQGQEPRVYDLRIPLQTYVAP